MQPKALTKQIEKIRSDRKQRLERIDYLRTAALPGAEMRERVEAWIAHEAQRFAPEHQLRGLWQDGETSTMAAPVNQHGILSQADLGPLFAWLAGDALEKALIEAMTPLCDDSAPRSAERPEAIEALEAEIRELEISEETLIREAEQAGETIERRADADPAIVLLADEALAEAA